MPLSREFREQFGSVQNPGRMTHAVVIERPVETRTDSGAVVNEWAAYAVVRMCVETAGGTEKFGVDSFESRPMKTFTGRWVAGVDTNMRLNLNGRYFDILDIDNMTERGRWMKIAAAEGRSHGNV